jgi:phosphatidylserine decarboxylase
MAEHRVFNFFSSRLAGTVCRQIGALADRPLPYSILKPAVALYAKGFGVNLDEATTPTEGFSCFGDFFARPLREGVRSISSDTNAIVSPCDGAIVDIHHFTAGHDSRLLVKGHLYNVDRLLGQSVGDRFSGGDGMVIYLHPRDYHRVHAPISATLHSVRHIPGHRFPVAPWSERHVAGIYEKNERMVFNFEVAAGHLSLIMVAAFGVGHIHTPFGPPLSKDMITSRSFEAAPVVERGSEAGAFRLGSTVVLLFSPGLFTPTPELSLTRILMGQKIGTVRATAEETR